MNLQNYFYVVPKAVPSRICDDIIRFGENQVSQIGITGGFEKKSLEKKDISKLYKTRNSSIVWMYEPWIWRALEPWINEANKNCHWNFQLSNAENFQFTKYSKSQHYSWHQDSFLKPDDNGLIRKISVTLSLEDGDAYEGGDFEFDLRNNPHSKPVIRKCEEARKKGSMIIFPSFIWHRVTPVKKGTRYSLVIWNRGNPFI